MNKWRKWTTDDADMTKVVNGDNYILCKRMEIDDELIIRSYHE